MLDRKLQANSPQEVEMKKVALAAALSLAATQTFAGGMATPVIEEPTMAPAVVEAQTSSSAGGIVVPLLLLLVIAAAAANK